MKPTTRNVIDLHCDTLYECHKRRIGLQNSELHFSLDKLPEGFRLCQCMAVYIPDELRGDAAGAYFDSVSALFFEQIKLFDAEISAVTDTAKIRQSLENKRFAAILTVEGGAAIAGKIENIERLYNSGVRMMTLTWNAENEICGGAATDVGFSDFGREAVAEMERLGMAVDVSHLSDKGFWQLCEFAKVPFAASHSNSRAICGHRRNLTDDMFKEIAKRGGVVGLNYVADFIRDDSKRGEIGDLLRHVHHFLELGGEDTLALGSDYDGTYGGGSGMAGYIEGIDKIGILTECLEKSGIPQAAVEKILFENANRYFVIQNTK